MHYALSYHSSITSFILYFFFFNDPATTEIYTLSLHDALPISSELFRRCGLGLARAAAHLPSQCCGRRRVDLRSEEHTSELQSLRHLVCRLLLEKKKKKNKKSLREYSTSKTRKITSKTMRCETL